jgi:hypothetical protein
MNDHDAIDLTAPPLPCPGTPLSSSLTKRIWSTPVVILPSEVRTATAKSGFSLSEQHFESYSNSVGPFIFMIPPCEHQVLACFDP